MPGIGWSERLAATLVSAPSGYTRRGRDWHKLLSAVHGDKLLTGTDLGTASGGPVMRPITFTADDRRALAHDRYYYPDPRVQRKMEVLWLKSHGLTHDQIATYANVSRRTVQRDLDEYPRGACHACAIAGGITPKVL